MADNTKKEAAAGPPSGGGINATALAALGGDGPDRLAKAFEHELSLSSRTVHADDYINTHRAVAPPLHVSATYRYGSEPDELRYMENIDPNNPYDSHIYSRDSAPNTTRLEAILTSVLNGPAITYGSGLAAFHALIVFLNPKRVAIGKVGYHGCNGVLRLVAKLTGLEQLDLDSEADLARLQPGDLVHVETPVNPTGEARDLDRFVRLARERGCYVSVDATFAPPPLQDPLRHGADVVMHSGTKYIGGHSDMLCGVLAVNPRRDAAEGWLRRLRDERMMLGSVMGSLEGWLGVRSLRTLELRVERQSASAGRLVAWLAGESKPGSSGNAFSAAARVVQRVSHASLQPEAADRDSWLRKQMPRGFGPVFCIWLRDERDARRLPSRLRLFHHATSLGGVESLIEWRAMTDSRSDRNLLRVSVGVEGWEDLKADLEQGFEALLREDGA
ncbi:uncharacterized protein E0L32_004317 [Thyridium curvatum]|uniref:Cystathionine gamma-synthase n=1 Tax=Thyridium curvatum TaxID=1093900 RepID=A0A507BEB7_9PEZI|nr:uncharacterized protein E0L32_004317 [Thyridium curvatum]TPX15619.1 hypothetical protein E0L32_004317 [Thyridium curvatum]